MPEARAKTPTVRLRPVEPGDLPALYENQTDPEAVRLAAVNPRTAADFHEHWRNVLADASLVPRAILADGEMVGVISHFHRDGEDLVGYWIARAHWGRGIATRALALLLEEVTTRPLHARVASHNAASIRVLERCGFTVTETRFEPATERYPACEVVFFTLH